MSAGNSHRLDHHCAILKMTCANSAVFVWHQVSSVYGFHPGPSLSAVFLKVKKLIPFSFVALFYLLDQWKTTH